jgi:LmbE family N-acetylglucosaminyl deacetylase
MGISSKDKILIVMPHPDDEAVFTCGFAQKLVTEGIMTKIVITTRGEKSTYRFGLKRHENLAERRVQEQKKAFKHIGITNFSILDFGDGSLDTKKYDVMAFLSKEIRQFLPTILVTLEPDGIYGHPDHIALSTYISHFHNRSRHVLFATVTPNYVFPKARKMAKKQIIKPIHPTYQLTLSPKESFKKFLVLHSHFSQFGPLLIPSKAFYQFTRNRIFTHEFFAFRKMPQ